LNITNLTELNGFAFHSKYNFDMSNLLHKFVGACYLVPIMNNYIKNILKGIPDNF